MCEICFAPGGARNKASKELLGVVLILSIFNSLLRRSLRVGFEDNDGVTYTLTRGGGHSMEGILVHFQILVTHRFARF